MRLGSNEKKKLFLFAAALLIIASLLFSESLRNMLSRRRDIRHAEIELKNLDRQSAEMREKIARLKSNPEHYDRLVRSELGYIKPGEKEVRFPEKSN